jgi:hypothetical protein
VRLLIPLAMSNTRVVRVSGPPRVPDMVKSFLGLSLSVG